MRAMQVPEHLVIQWERSIALLSRVWVISSDHSKPLRSTNGYPEGDTWSVVVMVLLSYVWVLSLKARASQCCIAAYADNWGWSCSHPPSQSVLLDTTVLFVTSTNMQIDWDKSWIWSTSVVHSTSLRQSIGRHVDPNRVAHVSSSMELGSQLTYRGPPRLGKFRNRLHTAHGRLDILRRLHYPLDEKTRLVTSGVYPCAFYGLQLIPVGMQHFDRLRTAVADCLLGFSKSRNSAIALVCIHGLDDPLVAAIILTLKAARRFLLSATADTREQFLNLAALSSGASQTCKGPASCLKHYITQIGWTIDRHGTLLGDRLHGLSLLGCSLRDIVAAVRAAWAHDVLLLHTDRVALRGLPPICHVSTKQVLGKFTVLQRQQILMEISGSFQTRSQQASWDTSVDGSCLACGQPDTREHRIHVCPVFSDIRVQFRRILDHFVDTGSLVHELPVVFVHPALEFIRVLQTKHPEAVVADDLWQKLHRLNQDLAEHGNCLHFYTDGSCQFSASTETCFGAYAVVLDTCLNDADRIHAARIYQSANLTPPTLVPLMAARTTGYQGINRSELFAIVRVVDYFNQGCLFTDSATSLTRIRDCLEATTLGSLGHHSDFDLLQRLWEQPHLGNFDFRKIKAHVDPRTLGDLLESYRCLGNQVVNDRAVQTCWEYLPELVQQYWSVHLDIQTEKEYLENYFHFLLALSQRRMELERQLNVESQLAEASSTTQRQDNLVLFQSWIVESAWTPPPPRATLFSEGTWGRTLTQAVFDWAKLIRWPDDGTPDRYGVTWMELTLSFLFHIGRWLPVKRQHGGTECLVVLTNDNMASTFFSEQVKTFCQLFAQTEDLSQSIWWPKYERGLVRSAYVLGAKTQPAGVRCRPCYPYQSEICLALHRYFKELKGVAYRDLPDVTFSQSLISDSDLRRETSGGWKTRSAKFHRAACEIRRCRKESIRPLMFH